MFIFKNAIQSKVKS